MTFLDKFNFAYPIFLVGMVVGAGFLNILAVVFDPPIEKQCACRRLCQSFDAADTVKRDGEWVCSCKDEMMFDLPGE